MMTKQLGINEVVVGVVGLGYVGLPLVVEIAQAGFKVFGFDIDEKKVSGLKQGRSHIEDISDQQVKKVLSLFSPTTDFSYLRQVNFIIIAVPTPLRKTKEPDISYIQSAIDQIDKYLTPPCAIVLESTTYPGTTTELITKRFLDKGFQLGKDFFVAFSPERVDPGNRIWKTKNTPKVIGPASNACRELIMGVYSRFIDTIVSVDSPEEAEMVKLLENTYRAVNIALVNELLMMSNRMKINFWSVLKAAATKPFGFQSFRPGPGIGGHCIPLDPQYLSWRAKSFNFYNRFIELASDINENMPLFVVNKTMQVLNQKRKSLAGSKILLLGLAYKKEVSDLRESPSIILAKHLKEMLADVFGCDPLVPFESIDAVVGVIPIRMERVQRKDFDLSILVTDHGVFTPDWILAHCEHILDTRGILPTHTRVTTL